MAGPAAALEDDARALQFPNHGYSTSSAGEWGYAVTRDFADPRKRYYVSSRWSSGYVTGYLLADAASARQYCSEQGYVDGVVVQVASTGATLAQYGMYYVSDNCSWNDSCNGSEYTGWKEGWHSGTGQRAVVVRCGKPD